MVNENLYTWLYCNSTGYDGIGWSGRVNLRLLFYPLQFDRIRWTSIVKCSPLSQFPSISEYWLLLFIERVQSLCLPVSSRSIAMQPETGFPDLALFAGDADITASATAWASPMCYGYPQWFTFSQSSFDSNLSHQLDSASGFHFPPPSNEFRTRVGVLERENAQLRTQILELQSQNVILETRYTTLR